MAYTNVFSPSSFGQNVKKLTTKVKSIYDQTPTPIKSAIGSGIKGVATSMFPTASSAYSAAQTASKLPQYAQKATTAGQQFYQGYTGQTPKPAGPEYKGAVQGPSFDPSKVKPTAQVPTPNAAQVTQPQSATERYLASMKSQADQQAKAAEERRLQNENYLKQQYGLANEQLQGQIGTAQGQFNQLKGNTEKTIADLLAGGETQKSQARDYYGEAQRLAAQTARETQGQTQRTFANLGTLDSRGEGSFGQATENQQSEFNRYTQQNLKAQADQLSQIDMKVGEAVRSAQNVIASEEAKLGELQRNIQYAIANNNLQSARELTAAYNDTQDYIAQIQDGIANMQYQFELEKEKLSSGLMGLENLSQEFLSSGRPTTQEDVAFVFRNPEGASSYQKLLGTGAKPKSASSLQVEGKAGAGLRALDTIESEILNNPTVLVQASIPGSPGARQFEAAVSSITDAIGGLRTGASVSPEQQKFYRNILPKAGDSPETIQYKINAIKQELQGYAQGAENMGTDVNAELLSILGLS